ncbi:hypothetical protein QL285_073520 [Trifolium repens]|jgi:hypothetical protein|nr:hypothetical protein QL285_073520 [Trifolium repens]
MNINVVLFQIGFRISIILIIKCMFQTMTRPIGPNNVFKLEIFNQQATRSDMTKYSLSQTRTLSNDFRQSENTFQISDITCQEIRIINHKPQN